MAGISSELETGAGASSQPDVINPKPKMNVQMNIFFKTITSLFIKVMVRISCS